MVVSGSRVVMCAWRSVAIRIPGVVLPDAIFKRLAAATDVADQAKIGQEIAAEQIRWIIREGWAGLYLMSPASTSGILPVLQAGLR